MPFNIIRQDIVNMDVDAVVCAGNRNLLPDGGVCGAIFKAAGEKELSAVCQGLAPIHTAQAVVSPGFNLKARFIIHTLGPVYYTNPFESAELLRQCYKNVLQTAADYKCSSIALPLISAGHFGYPKEEALNIAVSEISEFLKQQDMDIYLTVYGKTDFAVSQKLMGSVEAYIDEHYIYSHRIRRNQSFSDYDDMRPASSSKRFPCPSAMPAALEKHMHTPDESSHARSIHKPDESSPVRSIYKPDDSLPAAALEDSIGMLDESFSQCLLRLIDLKGKTDVEVYKKANMDRKLFSKIRSNSSYSPSKRTALALAVALELNLAEADSFLEKAGYTLSHSIKSDVIVEYFIVNGNYNIFEINEVLFAYDQALL